MDCRSISSNSSERFYFPINKVQASTDSVLVSGNLANRPLAKKGGKDMAEVAAEKAADILANHKPMPLSDEAKSAIRAIVEEATAENEEMNKK